MPRSASGSWASNLCTWTRVSVRDIICVHVCVCVYVCVRQGCVSEQCTCASEKVYVSGFVLSWVQKFVICAKVCVLCCQQCMWVNNLCTPVRSCGYSCLFGRVRMYICLCIDGWLTYSSATFVDPKSRSDPGPNLGAGIDEEYRVWEWVWACE